MKIAVVGATGMVGGVMIKVLEEYKIPISNLIPVASSRSIGKEIQFNGENYTVISMQDAIALRPDIAIFSAGGSTSKKWAPKFKEAGTTVIDNSSAWRMFPEIPLVVPEINACSLTKDDKIIANPNCSTIQMVLALSNLHKNNRIKRLVISTYQSVTGTGVKAVEQMDSERANQVCEQVYPHPIDLNVLPHGGNFDDDGYTSEEIKLVNETRKILNDQDIRITATVVRVPVKGGHSESVNIEFENDFELEDVIQQLHDTPGVVVEDEPDKNIYPMPLTAEGKNEVFVGRIRKDFSNPNSLNIWIVSDNLRKGAATNAVQIADYLIKNELI
jgi:aspartate-semialdehyde dehydrogenase